MKRFQKQEMALLIVIIVMLVGLAYELMYIENILRTAVLTPEKECRDFCNSMQSINFYKDGQCYCKEPISLEAELYCLENETIHDNSIYGDIFNTTQVRNLAVTSVVMYDYPNNYETRVFGIYQKVSERLKYVSDPRKDDYIAQPKETWDVGGGDCDDSAILLASMYESIGLDSKIVQIWNETYGHVFVLLRVESDPGIFMKGYEIMMNFNTLFYGPKTMNFVVLDDDCSNIQQRFDSGEKLDIYVTIDSNALGYAGHNNPLKRVDNHFIFEVGES